MSRFEDVLAARVVEQQTELRQWRRRWRAAIASRDMWRERYRAEHFALTSIQRRNGGEQ